MYNGIFDELSRQYSVLVYERDRLRALAAQRNAAEQGDRGTARQQLAPTETEYEYKLQAKIDALNEALRGLAKLLEL